MSKERGTSLFKKSHSQWCTIRHKKQTIYRSHESSIVPAERTHPLCWLHSALSFISALVPENFLVPLLLRSVHALKTNKQTKQINQTRGPFWEEKISKQTASSPTCRWKTSPPFPLLAPSQHCFLLHQTTCRLSFSSSWSSLFTLSFLTLFRHLSGRIFTPTLSTSPKTRLLPTAPSFPRHQWLLALNGGSQQMFPSVKYHEKQTHVKTNGKTEGRTTIRPHASTECMSRYDPQPLLTHLPAQWTHSSSGDFWHTAFQRSPSLPHSQSVPGGRDVALSLSAELRSQPRSALRCVVPSCSYGDSVLESMSNCTGHLLTSKRYQNPKYTPDTSVFVWKQCNF